MREQKGPDYDLFLKWFAENGGLTSKISFPVEFQPTNYIGLGASEDIQAHEIMMAVPKKIIISPSMIRGSELWDAVKENSFFVKSEDPTDSADSNLITLYVLWQQKLGKKSFFYPYFQAITLAENINHWTKEQVEEIGDPNISVSVQERNIKNLVVQFQESVKVLVEHFGFSKEEVSWEIFLRCQGIVSTRCFGWGLPETMLIPFADFLNHSSSGVHTYTFSRRLQNRKHDHYIRKRKELNLSIFGIENKNQLPVSYIRNEREEYIHENRKILAELGIQYNPKVRLSPDTTKKLMQQIQKIKLERSFSSDVLNSSDEEDNDSEDEKSVSIQEAYIRTHLNKMVKNELQDKFSEPKPTINRQFEEGINFKWWKDDSNQCFFILATQKPIKKGNQIYNCYGKRSNRFLLSWYGFTFPNNKYDSISFRLENQQSNETRNLVFFEAMEYLESRKYPQFRLKKSSICYELFALLRLRVIRKNPRLKEMYLKRQIPLHQIKLLELEREALNLYSQILQQVSFAYQRSQEKQISDKSRKYFAKVLKESNYQIIKYQKQSISILQHIIEQININPTLQHLKKLYRRFYSTEEESDLNTKIENRKRVIDYVRLIERFLLKYYPQK